MGNGGILAENSSSIAPLAPPRVLDNLLQAGGKGTSHFTHRTRSPMLLLGYCWFRRS